MKYDPTEIKIAIAELTREKNVRERYYPRAVAESKLTQKEAERRLEALKLAIKILQTLLQDLKEQEVRKHGALFEDQAAQF